MIRTGVDFAKNNGDETVMVFLRYENTVSTIVAELRGEAAEYVAALEAKLKLAESIINQTPSLAMMRELEECKAKLEAMERLRSASEELLEVAKLRGDNDMPHPANDDKLWTARMQTAWDEFAAAQQEKE